MCRKVGRKSKVGIKCEVKWEVSVKDSVREGSVSKCE